ncbi:Shedu immune nuclease family protein [Pseudomonas sp. A-R-26]|uniref:Shedu immune nuclease family protein n=1 Tax=Pseudomonas sp. A-R-26 TaxID=2832404 RepID=UPI001CBACA96|nr:Shedu immune nuclease family protein [Pseudomonas sp. A-R-26]
MYDAESVFNPSFRLVPGQQNGELCRNLYMETFFTFEDTDDWYPYPEDEWHRLACIFPDRIATYPVFTNPHAQRYLTRRHGRIKTIVYEMKYALDLPETTDAALTLLDLFLTSRIWNSSNFGLGLVKDLETICAGLMRLPDVDTLVVTHDDQLRIDHNCARIPEQHLDELRRTFDRTNRRLKERIRAAKHWHVRNALLAKLAPAQFPTLVQVTSTGEMVEYRMASTKRSAAMEKQQRQASVRTVRQNARQIAKDAPQELFNLHAEIERVTLANMIELFEKKLQQQLTEAHWQRFFEDNIFILSLLFARPVQLLQTQFHAQVSGLDGSGAQIGDFLFRELGQPLAIVEIKKPTSPLMQSSAYRNNKVFGPHAELSGAVTQVLYQQTSLRNNWLLHQSSLQGSQPDAIKCIVICGTTPTEPEPRRCFDIFRHACKDVEVVTFDELLGKLKLLLQHLNHERSSDDATGKES